MSNLPPGVMLYHLEPDHRFGARRQDTHYVNVVCDLCQKIIAVVEEAYASDVRDTVLVMCEHCGKRCCAPCVARVDDLTYCADCRKVCACGHIIGQHWARGCDKDGCQCGGFKGEKS